MVTASFGSKVISPNPYPPPRLRVGLAFAGTSTRMDGQVCGNVGVIATSLIQYGQGRQVKRPQLSCRLEWSEIRLRSNVHNRTEGHAAMGAHSESMVYQLPEAIIAVGGRMVGERNGGLRFVVAKISAHDDRELLRTQRFIVDVSSPAIGQR